jgi:hypothetical protein
MLGVTRIASTNTFGHYRFENVRAGESYVLSASSRRYTFAEPTRLVSVADDLTGIDFLANGP